MINLKYIYINILALSICFPSNNVVKVGDKAPTFYLTTLDGRNFFISDELKKGKPILLNFFATWCGPCREEHVYLKKLSNDKKLKIIGINYKDDPKKTIQWLNKLGNPYSYVISDNNGRLGIDWGVYGIPETFIVSSKGVIKYKLVGPITKRNYDAFYSKVLESEK